MAYPNPTPGGRPVTFAVAVPQDGARVSVSVYSVTGRLLARLIDSRLAAGRVAVQWDGRDKTGQQAEPGIYFIRAQVGATHRVARVLVTD